jgi:hypothetical protein
MRRLGTAVRAPAIVSPTRSTAVRVWR